MKRPVVLALALAGCNVGLGGGERAAPTRGPADDSGLPAEDTSVDTDTGAPDTDTGVPDTDTSVPDPGTDLAVVTEHTLPSNLACGATTTATVTMRNTGSTTWSSGENYTLQAVNSEDLFLTDGETVALAADVRPGGEYTFNLTLSAPGAGTYPTQWHMNRGGVYTFGEVAESNVSVACDGTFWTYPAVLEGTYTMPAHEQRIASRDASLLLTGNVITGDDDIDNAVLGGGSPDGGIWLSGSFHFEIDAAGQNTAASWITVFGEERYSVNGGMYPNGELHMGSPAGLDISGLFKNGQVTGYVAEAGLQISFEGDIWNQLPTADQNYIRGIWHGSDLSYVHGRMAGTGALY